jgi:hypothetical protein
MTQFLPLHVNSKHQYAPVFEVISKNQRLVPISQFPHSLSESTPNLRIPEDAMFMRGRSWEDIKQDNPGGEVYYSSDNDVTPELRAHLGLQDPKLTKLPGNHIFDSTESVIGIHTPYLYLGNPYTMFALHQEDYCALSFNYTTREPRKCGASPVLWTLKKWSGSWRGLGTKPPVRSCARNMCAMRACLCPRARLSSRV